MSLRIKVQGPLPAGDYVAPHELIPYIDGMTSSQFDQFIKGTVVDARPSDMPVEVASGGEHKFTGDDVTMVIGETMQGEFAANYRYSEHTPWKKFGRDEIDPNKIAYLPSQMEEVLTISSTGSSSSSSQSAPRPQPVRTMAPRPARATEAMLRSKHWNETEDMIQSTSGVPVEYATAMAKVNWAALGGDDTYDYMGTDTSAGPGEQRAAMRYIISRVGTVDDAKLIVRMKKAGRVPADETLKLAVIKVSHKMIEFILPEDSLAKRGGDFMPYIRLAFLSIKAKRELPFVEVEGIIPAFIGGKLVDDKPKSSADQLRAKQAFHATHFRFLKGIFTADFVAKVKFTE